MPFSLLAKSLTHFVIQKCDGLRPICGPCARHPKDDPCEYADGPGRSRTKVLEDTVSRLEARLRELENPELSSPSVTLHDPYNPGQYEQPLSLQMPSHSGLQLSMSPLSPPLHSPDSFAYTASQSSPFSVTSTLSATSTPPPGTTFRDAHGNVAHVRSAAGKSSPLSPSPLSPSSEALSPSSEYDVSP